MRIKQRKLVGGLAGGKAPGQRQEDTERERIRRDKKVSFIKALAKFLVGDQAAKSIWLEMEKPLAKEWADLRNHTPIFGWIGEEEAEKILTEFLK